MLLIVVRLVFRYLGYLDDLVEEDALLMNISTLESRRFCLDVVVSAWADGNLDVCRSSEESKLQDSLRYKI
ncbi:hypothetical protein J6590_084467 [Homalodisca vitripennis]|nr:hypothetical protein J6590_084467 [Homalodisca vitripennis]